MNDCQFAYEGALERSIPVFVKLHRDPGLRPRIEGWLDDIRNDRIPLRDHWKD